MDETEGKRFSKKIIPNLEQGNNIVDEVTVEALIPQDLPENLTRLGRDKLIFLIKGVAQIKPVDRVLEIFGGSTLSTKMIRENGKPKKLVSIDLHYVLNETTKWRYVIEQGERNLIYIGADARFLPIGDFLFDVVIAPDPPRTSNFRSESNEELSAGIESELSYEGQRDLFFKTAQEALRVLVDRGTFVSTAPLSFTRQLHEIGFSKVQIFSSEKLGNDVTKISINPKLQFRIKGFEDPVVYVRCVK